MSNSDSFIEEVTEEVRRDRLFAVLQRYGWIAVTLIVVLVGAAAYNEWRKARSASAAETFGDQVLAALDENEPSARALALKEIDGTPRQQALLAMFAAQESLADSTEGAADALETLSNVEDLPQVYRELAVLKFAMRDDNGLDPEERIERLMPLTIPGAPYRLLALEQTALAEIEKGEPEAALERLRGILAEDQVSQGLRRRVSQLIVALGGTLDAA